MSHIQNFGIYGGLYNKVGHILLEKPYVGLFGGVLAVMLSHGPHSVEGYHIRYKSGTTALPYVTEVDVT